MDEMMTNVAQYESHIQEKKIAKELEQVGCSDDDIYTVERIVAKKKVGQKTQYLVKWEGYCSDQNTWEPLQNLKNVRDLLKKFNIEQLAANGTP